jgi:hypothetical protein
MCPSGQILPLVVRKYYQAPEVVNDREKRDRESCIIVNPCTKKYHSRLLGNVQSGMRVFHSEKMGMYGFLWNPEYGNACG